MRFEFSKIVGVNEDRLGFNICSLSVFSFLIKYIHSPQRIESPGQHLRRGLEAEVAELSGGAWVGASRTQDCPKPQGKWWNIHHHHCQKERCMALLFSKLPMWLHTISSMSFYFWILAKLLRLNLLASKVLGVCVVRLPPHYYSNRLCTLVWNKHDEYLSTQLHSYDHR